MVSAPPLNPQLSLDIDGDGISTLVLPGMEFNGFGRSSDDDDIRQLVDQFNKTMPTSVTGMRTPQNQVVPTITLPAAFSNGDTFFSTDVRLTRVFSIKERVKLQFMAEAFNLFNIAKYLRHVNGLVQTAAFGQPTVRGAQIFGSGGPRAFQFGARLSF